jgi:hypothetical protein
MCLRRSLGESYEKIKLVECAGMFRCMYLTVFTVCDCINRPVSSFYKRPIVIGFQETRNFSIAFLRIFTLYSGLFWSRRFRITTFPFSVFKIRSKLTFSGFVLLVRKTPKPWTACADVFPQGAFYYNLKWDTIPSNLKMEKLNSSEMWASADKNIRLKNPRRLQF